MPQCFNCFMSVASTSANLQSSSPTAQGISANSTPRSSALSPQPSPTVNLTREYALSVQTNSYSEIWSKIHPSDLSFQDIYRGELESHEEQRLLMQVLQPNRECVQAALRGARSGALKELVSAYFDQSEHTSRLCLRLHHDVHRLHCLYSFLHDLLDTLPSELNSLNQSQCDRAFDVFLQFDCRENHFACPNSLNFDDMRYCFSQLREQLDGRLSKSRSRVRLLQGATTSSGPFLPILLPSRITKRELARMAQLDAAAMGAYVLHNDLDTIDRLVARLHSAVESDKFLVHLVLERGREKHPMQEVLKQLQKNRHNFLHQLEDLEEHLCLCFAAINRARSLLHDEIHPPSI